MSEMQQYHDVFATGYWATIDRETCPCHGTGWALSQLDTWHRCPIHYVSQVHPESFDEKTDIEVVFEEEESYAEIVLEQELNDTRQLIERLQAHLASAQAKLAALELQLVNSTPTVKMPAAVSSTFDEGWSLPKLEIVPDKD